MCACVCAQQGAGRAGQLIEHFWGTRSLLEKSRSFFFVTQISASLGSQGAFYNLSFGASDIGTRVLEPIKRVPGDASTDKKPPRPKETFNQSKSDCASTLVKKPHTTRTIKTKKKTSSWATWRGTCFKPGVAFGNGNVQVFQGRLPQPSAERRDKVTFLWPHLCLSLPFKIGSMTPKCWVMTPFFKGHEDSRYC